MTHEERMAKAVEFNAKQKEQEQIVVSLVEAKEVKILEDVEFIGKVEPLSK